MQQSTNIVYDGSFDGFLTSVFEIYESRIDSPIILKENRFENELFAGGVSVITDQEKAKRVWNSLKNILKPNGCYNLFTAFLSELEGIENTIFNVIKYAFEAQKNVSLDYSNQDVLRISKVAKKVSRERHRMKAFVRFQQTKDGIYFAKIEPDFNVLPLISSHFTKRYADQKWIIYDLKRHYGLYYNLDKTEYIALEHKPSSIQEDVFSKDELAYETLWKDYFKSTNIEERINTALHIKHVPKRYWKYLSEKQP